MKRGGGQQNGRGWNADKTALPFINQLADFSRRQGTVIDVLAVGMPLESSTVLSKLAADTGGVLMAPKGLSPFPSTEDCTHRPLCLHNLVGNIKFIKLASVCP